MCPRTRPSMPHPILRIKISPRDSTGAISYCVTGIPQPRPRPRASIPQWSATWEGIESRFKNKGLTPAVLERLINLQHVFLVPVLKLVYEVRTLGSSSSSSSSSSSYGSRSDSAKLPQASSVWSFSTAAFRFSRHLQMTISPMTRVAIRHPYETYLYRGMPVDRCCSARIKAM